MSDDVTEKVPFEQQVLENLASINLHLTALETKAEERSRDTRPMWEQLEKLINDRFDAINDHLDRIEGLQDVWRAAMSRRMRILRS